MSSSVVDTVCVEELYNCVGWELPNSIIILLGDFLPAYIRGLINTISRVFSTWAATQYTYSTYILPAEFGLQCCWGTIYIVAVLLVAVLLRNSVAFKLVAGLLEHV